MGKLAHVPLSLTPIKSTPGRLWVGKSLAKAQIASQILSWWSVTEDFLSTRSDSRSLSKANSSLSSMSTCSFTFFIEYPDILKDYVMISDVAPLYLISILQELSLAASSNSGGCSAQGA